MDRYSQTKRIFALLGCIKLGRRTLDELKSDMKHLSFDVCSRTIRRDLAFLIREMLVFTEETQTGTRYLFNRASI